MFHDRSMYSTWLVRLNKVVKPEDEHPWGRRKKTVVVPTTKMCLICCCEPADIVTGRCENC